MRAYICATLVLLMTANLALSEPRTYALQNGRNGPAGHPYTGCEDTHISSGRNANVTPGGAAELRVGRGDHEVSRALMRFNFADIRKGWTDDSRIVGARLRLYVNDVEGPTFRGKRLNLHRVSSANRNWAAGGYMDDGSSGSGFACWKWIAYDDTNYSMSDARAKGFEFDVPRRFPWAGDKEAFEQMWPDLSTFSSSGCGVAGTDYIADPIATAAVAPGDGGWVTLAFDDTSFLDAWVGSEDQNTGFLLHSSELESGRSGSKAMLIIVSSENAEAAHRPILELDIANFDVDGSEIVYEMPYDGKVSISIFDSLGAETRKLASSSPRRAGQSREIWDGKTDSVNWGESVRTVPDGDYTVKILAHQGLSAEYLVNIGMSFPIWEGAPGGYTGPPRAIALEGTQAVYVPGKGHWWGEGAQRGGFKMKPDGTRLVSYEGRPFSQIYTAAMAHDAGKVYYYGKGGVYVKPDPDNPENSHVKNIVEHDEQEWAEGVTVNAADIAAYRGIVVPFKGS